MKTKTTKSSKSTKGNRVGTKKLAQSYRVIRIEKGLRESCKQHRAASGVTIKTLLEKSVHEQVPVILDTLAKIGLTKTTGERKPARWPMDAGLITELKEASAQCGLPAVTLLFAALRLHTAKPSKKSKARS